MAHIAIGQHTIWHEWSGQGDDVLVLFNGITMSTIGWTWMMPILEARYRVLRFDFPGQGQSSPAPLDPQPLADQAATAIALLDTLGLDKVHLAGLSYGGMVAQHLARHHSDRLHTLVLASTLAWADPLTRHISHVLFAAEKAGGFDLRFDVSVPWLFSNHFLARHGDRMPDMKQLSAQASWPDALRLSNGVLEHDARTWLDVLRVPCRVLVGSEDKLTPPAQSEILASRIPGATLSLIPEAGHTLHLEAPEAFARAIAGFCHR